MAHYPPIAESSVVRRRVRKSNYTTPLAYPAIIGLAGHSGNASSKVADDLAAFLQRHETAKFGTYFRRAFGAPHDRKRLMDLADMRLRELGPTRVCQELLQQSRISDRIGPMVIDGIRHVDVAKALRELVRPHPFLLIYIGARPEFRMAQLSAYGYGNPKALEEMDRHPTEREVEDVSKLADMRVNAEEGTAEGAEHVAGAVDQIQSVVQRPTSAAARLEFASLLDPDDPRRRYVEVQAERQRLRRENPRGVEWADKYREEKALLKEYGAGWMQLLAPYNVHKVTLRGGFIDEIAVDAAALITNIDYIFGAAPILHVRVTSGERSLIRQLFAHPKLRQLVSLSVAGLGLDDRDLAALTSSGHFQYLRWLDVSRNRITDAGVRLIARELPRLQHVNLDGNIAASPIERFGVDGISGDIVRESVSLPPFGRAIEQDVGRVVDWLHGPSKFADYPPALEDIEVDSSPSSRP